MKPQVIHSSSKSVKTVGTIFIVLGILSILLGFVFLFIEERNAGTGGILIASSFLTILVGSLIKGVSPLVRAAETYLYEMGDHPLGSTEDIKRIQSVADHGVDLSDTEGENPREGRM